MNNLKKISDFLFRNKVVSGLIFILTISFVLGGRYYWTTTPQYTLSQIKKAYSNQNVTLALRYIDTDSIFDDYWQEVQKTSTDELAQADNGWESLGIMMGQSMLEGMKPAMKEILKESIIQSVKDGSTESALGDATDKPVIYRDGDMVVVEVADSIIKLNLKKTGRYWKVVAIKGMGNLVDQASDNGGIKSKLSSLRITAELHFDKDFSYVGLCDDFVVANILQDIENIVGERPYCRVNDPMSYKISAKLNGYDAQKYFCIDSNGSADEIESSKALSAIKMCKE